MIRFGGRGGGGGGGRNYVGSVQFSSFINQKPHTWYRHNITNIIKAQCDISTK